ncbi:hypothetical protein ACFLQ0_01850 [Nitrospinota bacterium]
MAEMTYEEFIEAAAAEGWKIEDGVHLKDTTGRTDKLYEIPKKNPDYWAFLDRCNRDREE